MINPVTQLVVVNGYLEAHRIGIGTCTCAFLKRMKNMISGCLTGKDEEGCRRCGRLLAWWFLGPFELNDPRQVRGIQNGVHQLMDVKDWGRHSSWGFFVVVVKPWLTGRHTRGIEKSDHWRLTDRGRAGGGRGWSFSTRVSLCDRVGIALGERKCRSCRREREVKEKKKRTRERDTLFLASPPSRL